jgi:predicted aldo/keto reductase-like oxidoreductase
VPYKTFAKLQDEFFAVSKQMRNEKDPEEKMKLLKELQQILKESHRVLEEIHKKQSNQK